MRHLQLAAAMCLTVATSALAEPINVTVVPDADVRISDARARQDGEILKVAARVGWTIPATSRRLDHIRVMAYSEGTCVGSTVRSWTPISRIQRLPTRAFHATLRLDRNIDEIRIARATDAPTAFDCRNKPDEN